MSWRHLLPLGLTFFVCFAAVTFLATPAEDIHAQARRTPTPNARQSAAVEKLFTNFIDDTTPGAAVLVSKDGQLVYRGGFGLADLEDSTPITPELSFHLGSVGKQFTAVAIMILAERGELAFDNPIGDYLPELPWGQRVTIRQLLNHTSGVPDYDTSTSLYDALFDRSDTPNNDDLLAVLSERRRLTTTAGRTFAYSNTGYDLLGILIERISGQSYADFMQETIFDPLEMTRSFSAPNRPRNARQWVVHSYTVDDDDELVAYDEDALDGLTGSGSIYASVDDLLRYDRALFGGELVSEETFAEALKPARLNNGRSSYYGFGWELDKDGAYITHAGAWLAFQSCYVHYLEQNFSVIVLFNQDYEDADVCEIAFEIAALYE
ncbi:serine hydrolase [bacterium]|nr:serine hydrolase [bacterium]